MRTITTITAAVLLLAVACPARAGGLIDIKLEQLSQPLAPAWGTDPFIRLEDRDKKTPQEVKDHPKFRVEGIITDGQKALAIIENGFYRRGDMLQGYVIEDILKDRVLLVRDGVSYTLLIEGFAVRGTGKESVK